MPSSRSLSPNLCIPRGPLFLHLLHFCWLCLKQETGSLSHGGSCMWKDSQSIRHCITARIQRVKYTGKPNMNNNLSKKQNSISIIEVYQLLLAFSLLLPLQTILSLPGFWTSNTTEKQPYFLHPHLIAVIYHNPTWQFLPTHSAPVSVTCGGSGRA